jgi:hypothetical protein
MVSMSALSSAQLQATSETTSDAHQHCPVLTVSPPSHVSPPPSLCVPPAQDVDQRRHLLRLWVAPTAEDGAHPLAPAFAELYHSTQPGARGGIYIEGYTETIPLEAEVGNKLAT